MPLVRMTETNDPNISKKLSSESKSLVGQLQNVATKATHIIPQLYDSLRKDGLEPFEARDYIEEIVTITRRQLTNILPNEAKHIEMVRKHEFAEVFPQNEPPQTPPPQVVREAETQTDYTITVTESKSPEYHEDTIITIKDKRFSFLELDRARLFAKSTGDSFITIGVRNNEIKIL